MQAASKWRTRLSAHYTELEVVLNLIFRFYLWVDLNNFHHFSPDVLCDQDPALVIQIKRREARFACVDYFFYKI